MTNNDFHTLDKIQQTIKDCTKKPEVYLSVQEQISQKVKNATKDLYDLAFRRKSAKNLKSEALPELIVKGFDVEQIWQQLELENNEEFGRLSLGKISKTLASKKSWVLPLKVHQEQDVDQKESEASEAESEQADEVLSEKSDNSSNKDDKTKPKTVKSKKRRRTTEVDDKFFKLDELDEYLQKEDKREMSEKKKNDDSSDEDNESIDLFKNFSESDNDDEEEDLGEDEIKNGKSVKYADFFDIPVSDDEEEHSNNKQNDDDDDDYHAMDDDGYDDDERFNDGESEGEERKRIQKGLQKEKKQVKFNLLENSDDSDSADNSKNKDDSNEDSSKTKSSLEVRQERLKERIKKLEEEAISEKPWQLKGEASALNRPQNSLLEEFVEFDSVSRPAPIMTEQTTMKLEDIIRKRIQDKAWDDVEKKFKPVETPMEYKKKLIMNQEKSKESLAQIYENEYIKQREALTAEDKDEQDKEEPSEHIEIREKMHSLFRKLDALSNFHYTPKPAKPEIKIVSNVPAINMEEVAPVATSDATLLAPEEIKSKHKGELIGKSERTKTDMKRARRKKKLNQHARAVNESKTLVSNVKQKKSLKNTVALGKLKARNVIVDEESTKKDGRSMKSSTAFFAQLQDQVESSIKAKTSTNVSKKNKNTISAVKLKL
ncbi:U3 small nucleolar ribonucleoprotein protein MPP10 [Nasonia vitripennis]|uniref:U3 small nucleolar ribonucleoprotein protein MPP10 n=1 Tax=Nasonia vitripennis TaxID=7425 RepID=A0A7M7G6E6_NASVI|nr:U3 small nucleolar ribonucleoprotein protein MPP10 [Nasonia vitripennis]